tara:strand:- start:230 stop:547 length:318 start_codon:yes stop_codon:yes gene_type:complete
MKEEYYKLLKKIDLDPNLSQRDLSAELDMSLGKINYCLRALKNKGLIKINNFKKNKNKINYLYALTPKGVMHKTEITIKFMKMKMREYDELKKELERVKNKKIKK